MFNDFYVETLFKEPLKQVLSFRKESKDDNAY